MDKLKQPEPNLEPQPNPSYRIWVEDAGDFSLDKISLLRHNYHEHPLLQIDQLEKLAQKLLPLNQCRFISPGATQQSEFIHKPKSPDGRDLAEVFERISEPGSWIALYNAETDPKYAQLVQEALATVEGLISKEQPGIFSPQAFIFISAPPSVTPFHIDRENNFWLQIRGQKIMNVWDRNDRDILPAPTVENFIIDKSLNTVTLRDEFMSKKFEWDLGASEGVYFPSTSPHSTRTTEAWVSPENGVSISIGVVFYTETTRKHAYIHSLNRFLRRMKLDPKFPGESKFDDIKFTLGKVLVGFKKRFRSYTPPTGF
ncbi:hypothetical protein [Marinobacter sediminum]|uniref:hypothetical protein n=1 Tax=Marinobacter sediminum TaxID=256323 RepID=UPI001939A8A1|nr:hypothetical protein [Marinobacter sediminum]